MRDVYTDTKRSSVGGETAIDQVTAGKRSTQTCVHRLTRKLDPQLCMGLVASLAAVPALGLATAFTLGGFNAAIANSTDAFSSAIIQLEESNGPATCYSTGAGQGGTVTVSDTNSACTINDFVGTLDQVVGDTALTTTLTFTNVGNYRTTVVSLVPGACTVANASDDGGYYGADETDAVLCSKVDITIANTTSGATDKRRLPHPGSCLSAAVEHRQPGNPDERWDDHDPDVSPREEHVGNLCRDRPARCLDYQRRPGPHGHPATHLEHLPVEFGS
ncbi:MAG: hypothetical protein ABSH04_03295 [Acidimicrobiales bacterium]